VVCPTHEIHKSKCPTNKNDFTVYQQVKLLIVSEASLNDNISIKGISQRGPLVYLFHVMHKVLTVEYMYIWIGPPVLISSPNV